MRLLRGALRFGVTSLHKGKDFKSMVLKGIFLFGDSRSLDKDLAGL